eukprot:TRINITY_DN5888_c0_g1_i11.p1 TRINITY_DN5888_c0_g1~~TRINITY_DN5888_c0_g1_i11.p1  ORF type:complete len:371 (-),score=78.30 TRINITY_DN5888_c0_g1_i11:1145-2257(-)
MMSTSFRDVLMMSSVLFSNSEMDQSPGNVLAVLNALNEQKERSLQKLELTNDKLAKCKQTKQELKAELNRVVELLSEGKQSVMEAREISQSSKSEIVRVRDSYTNRLADCDNRMKDVQAKYDKVQEFTRNLQKEKSDLLTSRTSLQQSNNLEDKWQHTSTSLASKTQRIRDLEEEIENKKKEINTLKGDQIELEKRREELVYQKDSKTQLKNNLKEEISRLRKQIEQFDVIPKLEEGIGHQSALLWISEEERRQTDEIHQQELSFASLNTQLSEIQSSLVGLESFIREQELEAQRLATNYLDLEEQVGGLKRWCKLKQDLMLCVDECKTSEKEFIIQNQKRVELKSSCQRKEKQCEELKARNEVLKNELE